MSRAAEAAAPAKVKRLTPRQKSGLALEALVAYARARRALSGSDLPTALAALRQGVSRVDGAEFSDADFVTGQRLGGAVRGTLVMIPKRSKCLMRSLTLTLMLARRGIDSSLVIAVRAEEEFGAHAWVEYHGRPLLPASKRRYERLAEL